MHLPTLVGGIVFTLLYVLCKWWAYLHYSFWEYLSYLCDLSCLPVILSAFYVFHYKFIRSDAGFRIPLMAVVVAFWSVSMVFEAWLPRKSTVYTADPLDVVMYLFGALIFIYYHRSQPQKGKDRQVPA